MSGDMSNKEYNTTQYIIALLKAYGIKNIVASPGTQNAYFNALVQDDSFFNCYSVVDERSACYVATGIAYETNEPVIITCTGATASRNYMSAMTEAYNKNLPVIAMTFYDLKTQKYKLSPQYIDRTVTQNDIKRISVTLPFIHDELEKQDCLIYLNAALSAAKYNGYPVHINAPNTMDFSQKDLPDDIWITQVYTKVDNKLEDEIKSKRTIVYVGSHNKFTQEEENAISNFAKNYNIPVVVDHTSNYHGANKMMVSQVTALAGIKKKPELVIDIGGISGEYISFGFIKKSKIWRISPSHEYHSRVGVPTVKQFNMSERDFFNNFKGTSNDNSYIEYIRKALGKVKLPELPLSNPLICQELSKHIQKNSSLHLSILNSFRSMNYFDLDETIDSTCNVGGFGIDGALSTLIGQSLVNPDKIIYGVVGDLAFFYDMNILGNRHIGKNVRIILVNNNRGEDFRLNPKLEEPLGNKTDVLISAGGHYKNGAKGWVESCGLHYMSAETKDEFMAQIKDFCTKDYKNSVIFEVFTKNEDEQYAYKTLRSLAKSTSKSVAPKKKTLLQKIFKLK